MADIKLQMEFVEDRGLAMGVMRKNRTVQWIPRSLVSYRRKWMNLGKQMVDFSVSSWFVEKEKLQDYITG